MSAASNSTNSTGTELCKEIINPGLFDLGCLGPALAIILVLAFLERRTKFKLNCCDGRPGLLMPFNFLGGFSNRYTIAATFGATASTCLRLILKADLFVLPGPPWLKVFQKLVLVLVYGILFYPYFACLTTDYKFIGSLLGFLYGVIRFSIGLVTVFQCLNEVKDEWSRKLYLVLFGQVPTYLCLLFIVMRFAFLLFLTVKKKWFWIPSERNEGHSSSRNVARKPEIIHVKHLLCQGSKMESVQDEWYLRLRNCFYKPRPDFKFSTQLISTLLVAAIALFQLVVASLVLTDVLKSLYLGLASNEIVKDLVRVVFDGLEGGVIVAAIVSVLMMLHFMKSHRDHVLQLYRGQSSFAQGVVVSPARLVGRSLRFCGYQVAYIIAGYGLLGSFLFVICTFVAFIFKFGDHLIPLFPYYREVILQSLLPPFVMIIFLWLVQLFLAHFVFRDRDFPNITITVDNRRLYSILSYFFFFYNIILGLFSAMMRAFKGMLLGVLFVSRIDRTSLMYGFQTWDRAFVAYLGFLHVLVAHRHPVLLTFCQLLIDRNDQQTLEGSSEERPPNTSIQRGYTEEPRVAAEKPLMSVASASGYGGTWETPNRITTTSVLPARHFGNPPVPPQVYRRELRLPRLSRRAANRWLLTATLIRNPSLIRYRRSGRTRPLVKLARTESDVRLVV